MDSSDWGWIGIAAALAWAGLAGSAAGAGLDSPAEPSDPASAMFTLQDVYNRLDTGAAGAKRAGPFAEPAAGPTAGTLRTTDEIMAKAPAVSASAAGDAEVLAGKEYWGLTAGAWGKRSGAMAIRILSAATAEVQAGYYAATNLAQVDPNLAAGNIRGGQSIFGVAGKSAVMETSGGTAAAGDILAGKKAYVNGALVTGEITDKALDPDSPALAAGIYGATNLAEANPNLAAANIRHGAVIFGVAGDNTNLADTSSGTATANDIKTNKVAWVGGAAVTGVVADQVLSDATRDVSAGIYPESDLAVVETDLVSANIRTNVTIFGVPGTKINPDVNATVGVPKTGQTDSYLKTGTDGNLLMGVAWPNPRFSDATGDPSTNAQIEVDYLTRLSWPYNWTSTANIGKPIKSSWHDALAACTNFHLGGYDDWRLPNLKEFFSLVYFGNNASGPTLCNRNGTAKWVWGEWSPFGLDANSTHSSITGKYWTSTTVASDTNKAWYVWLSDGTVGQGNKEDTGYFVIPVRGWPRE